MPSKLPYMQFYPNDWIRDTQFLTAAAKGAWIAAVCQLWGSQTRGQITLDLDSWARIFGCTPHAAGVLCDELEMKKVAGVQRDGNGHVTLVCRRMVREETTRLLTRKRVKRLRNARCNASETPVLRQCNRDISEVRCQKSDVRSQILSKEKKSPDISKEASERIRAPDSGRIDYASVKPEPINCYEDLHAIADPIVAAISLTGETNIRAWGYWVKILNAAGGNGEASRKFFDVLSQLYGEIRAGEVNNPGAVLNHKLKSVFGAPK